MNLADYDVHRMLIDNGSYVDILFYEVLLRMNISLKRLEGTYAPITEFFGELVPVEGTIVLPVVARQAPCRSLVHLTFTDVKTSSAYNAILGWPRLNVFHAIVSIYYLFMKLPIARGVGKVHGNQALAK